MTSQISIRVIYATSCTIL